jgi:gas vesicle protein
MACVSLKALEGRVGKVTTLFQSKFGINVLPAPTNEGVADMIKNAISKMKDSGSNFVKKVKGYMTEFTDWSKEIKSHIVNIFSPTSESVVEAQVEVKEMSEDAEEVLAEFDKEIVEHMNRSGKAITEASEDEPIQITSCFRDQLLNWYSKFDNDTKQYNKIFNEFQNTVKEYSTKNFFRVKFESLPEKNREFNEELK